jgi:hypothetical protein
MSNYPEHDKMHAIVDKSQAIGEFLDWLSQHERYALGEVTERLYYPGLYRASVTIPQLLAEYFGIDQAKIDAEKDQMLDELRAMNSAKAGVTP